MRERTGKDLKYVYVGRKLKHLEGPKENLGK